MRKNKIRILHVAQAAGGVDRYIRMLLKYLDKEKFENILVCSQDFHEEDYRGLADSFEQVEMTRAIGGNDLKAIREVRALIKKYNPNIVYREVVRIANLNFASWGNLAYNFKANSMNADLEGAGLSSFVQQINKITKGFAYAFLFVFVNNIFAQKTKTERIANFANLIPGVLFSAQCILKGGRFPVVAFIIGAFFLYYYFWRRTKGWGKVIPVKYIVRIVLIIAGVIAAFWFSKELVGRLSKDNDLMGYVTRYFGGGPVLFELYLKDSSMLHDAPNETFAGLISSLNKFGFNLTGRAYHEFRAASGITIGNAYSALRNYYHDYSIFGVILFNYILTFVFSIKYYDLKYCSDITYKKAFSLTLYASFIYTVFFQFFTDYFFARLSVGLFIEVIVLRICFWFVMRLKVCFGRR